MHQTELPQSIRLYLICGTEPDVFSYDVHFVANAREYTQKNKCIFPYMNIVVCRIEQRFTNIENTTT